MKHSQYRRWILDDIELDADEQRMLAAHLSACEECRHVKTGWEASLNLLTNPVHLKPAPGFTDRWQKTLARKTQLQKVRRYRLMIAGFILLAFISSLIYLIASGSFLHMLAATFNSIAQLAIAFTSGLSSIGIWLGRLPVAVPVVAGFLMFGLMTAFLMAAAFALWNINNRKRLAHEIISD